MNRFRLIRADKRTAFICTVNILFIMLLATVGLTGETKDDMGLQLYISDCDGVATYYHQWSSALRIVSTFILQKLIPQFAWNYLLQVVFIWISINVICVEIRDKVSGCMGILLGVFASVVLFFQSISIFNFTRTSALVMCAGICLLLHEKKSARLAGGFLLVYAAAFRISILCLAVGFIAVICLWKWMETEGTFRHRLHVTVRACVVPMAAACIVALIVELAGQMYITSHPEWRKIYNRCLLSGEVMDFGLEDYEDVAELYSQYGISENDYTMINKRFSNSDTGYFSDAMYHLIIGHSSKKWELELSGERLKIWYTMIKGRVVKDWFSWCILGMLILTTVFYRKREKWLPILTLLCLGAYVLLFCIMGRVMDRVLFGVYLCAGITLLICYTEDDLQESTEKVSGKFRLPACGAKYILFLLIAVFTIFAGLKYRRNVNQSTAGVYDYMEGNRQFFYFYTQLSEDKAVENLMLVKEYWNTGNSMYSSDYDFAVNTVSKYREYGIENIYRDAVDSEVIRFIDRSDNTDIDVFEMYIQEHYCNSAHAVLTDEINGYNVYKFIS